jgi:hypothetical protein
LQAQARLPLKDAAAVNASRWARREAVSGAGPAARNRQRRPHHMEPHPAEPAKSPLD